jgi:hypothetical protein
MPFLRMAFAGALLLSVSVELALLPGCGGSDPGAGAGAAGVGGSGGTRGGGGAGGIGGTQPPGAQLDLSNISFVHNLLAKVDDGEWTLEEGLIATLEVIAGERDAAEILRHPKLLNHEGTGIVMMADEYLQDGPDEEAKAEMARLLDLIVFSTERLEAMVVTGEPGLAPTSTKGATEDCFQYFRGTPYTPPAGVGNCLQEPSILLLDQLYPGDFRVFGPALPLPDAGWKQRHFDLAIAALEETVPIFKAMGTLTQVSVVLSATQNGTTLASAYPKAGRPCGVVLYTVMQGDADEDFKQVVAHEIAHCFQKDTFPGQTAAKYRYAMWREEGLAHYLSNLVYPSNNREWGEPPQRRSTLENLQENELTTTVLQRAYSNFIFFQYLGNRLGNEGLFGLVRTLPTGPGTGAVEQASKLAAYPNMKDIYQDFAKDLTDKKILDTSTQVIPYELTEDNRPTSELTGPLSIVRGFDRFSVSRRRLTLEEGKRADLNYTPKGDVSEEARPDGAGEWFEVPSELPTPECVKELIVVVTSIEPSTGYELEVPEVEDAEAACGIVGTWVVDLGSIKFNPGFSTLDYVTGGIRITFNSDGTADPVYSGYEYRFSRVTELYQEILELLVVRTEEYTYTTNATGMTTYQVDGNEIEFGHFSESAYLVGNKTVREVRKFEPQGIIGNNSDETRDRSPGGLGYFGSFVTFELDPGGSVMRILGFDDEVELVLNRIGSPP